ncbi:hypothetical protein PV396_24675 [Streptomyces sp. ME02-8801-2C]|uniref:hypothetical protein n=1 Tax=Streptomyces sp. ME02-8801-2C TaxID=3028680 RepID=UPI0029A0FFB3|nr:hypothetical protein [Streptomyces sp. ME02-8801-2C]MDX3455098.1 hypothetical protein [Streptomyces sp. ME02-8801-2C]
MEQATATTPTASPETRAPGSPGTPLQQAYAVAGRIIGHLTTLPRSIDLARELDGEYSVHVMWSHDVSGVRALAAWANASWDLVPSDTGIGVYAETRPRVGGITIWAWTLLSKTEAEQARLMLPPPDPQPTPAPPDGEDQAADDTATVLPTPTAMPLGSSILAHVTAVSPQAGPEADAL